MRLAAVSATLAAVAMASVSAAMRPEAAVAVDASRRDLEAPAVGRPVELTTILREAPGTHEPTARGLAAKLTLRLRPVGEFYQRIAFRLVAPGLGGRITTAHIHLGRGPRGGVVTTLCGRPRGIVETCDLPAMGQGYLSNRLLTLMRLWGAYVDVHLRRSSQGKLRGRLVLPTVAWRARDEATASGTERTTAEVTGADRGEPVAARMILTAPKGVVYVDVTADCTRRGLWVPPRAVAVWRLASRGLPIVRRLPASLPRSTSCRWVVNALGGAGHMRLRLETVVKP